MIKGRSVLAIIPARGGSKGVPRKNLRDVNGKPLLSWTIEEAKRSTFIDTIVVSSDDAEINSLAKRFDGVSPLNRPSNLAGDDASLVDVVIHASESQASHDLYVLLQPTSPLRTAKDIDGALERIVERKAPSCVSVTEVSKSPLWMYEKDDAGKLKNYIPQSAMPERRQLTPQLYLPNGAIYIVTREAFFQQRTFITAGAIAWEMSAEKSIDIDTELDLKIASYLLKERGLTL